ncbi:MAG: penicillin-binding transpeptidase domain-containing protein [Turicibacter sp.]|nr:penicillin-binding transpeptidase domain-containing protein [Turicibacter sp.]
MLMKVPKKMTTLAFRIQMFKVITIFLLILLGERLYQMQILYAEEYRAFLDQSATMTTNRNVPRGRIYDRNLNILVDNEAVPVITYTFSTGIGPARMWEMAYEVAGLIGEANLDGDARLWEIAMGNPPAIQPRVRHRDLQDLWLRLHDEEARERVAHWISLNPEMAVSMLEVGFEQLDRIASGLPNTLSDDHFYAIQLLTVSPAFWAQNHPQEAMGFFEQWLGGSPEAALEFARSLAGPDATPTEAQSLLQGINNDPGAYLQAGIAFSAQIRNRINEEIFRELTPRQRAAQAFFNAMNQGVSGTVNILLNGATEQELTYVAVNLSSRRLEGVNVGTGWNRIYPSAIGNSDIFGRVTSYEQGLPGNQAGRLRAMGFANNSRVGTGQIEEALEGLLRGTPSEYSVVMENGAMLTQQVIAGQPGMNASLTLDLQLQSAVDGILRDTVIHYRTNTATGRFLREGYVVLLDPNTGEILSMNGIQLNEDSNGNLVRENGGVAYELNPLGTIWSAFEMGSTVKGGTLLQGFYEGLTHIGTVRHDRPFYFAASPRIASWENMGNINDVNALARSSNIFFMEQTLAAMGISYYHHRTLPVNHERMAQQREFFARLGLGTTTGIEVWESEGNRLPVNYGTAPLFHNIGQADTYTTMQLAQYTMTLANGGYRFATQLVRDIYLPSHVGDEPRLHHAFSPRLLNRIDLDQRYFDRIRDGFVLGVQGSQGTGTPRFAGTAFNPAGKTGTSQSFLLGSDGMPRLQNNRMIEVHHVSFVGWAPANDPQVAVAVILPAGQDPDMVARRQGSNFGAQTIARDAMQAFFDLREAAAAGTEE